MHDPRDTVATHATGEELNAVVKEGFVQVKRKALEPRGSRQTKDPKPLYPTTMNPFEVLMDDDNPVEETPVPLQTLAPEQMREHIHKEVHTPKKYATDCSGQCGPNPCHCCSYPNQATWACC